MKNRLLWLLAPLLLLASCNTPPRTTTDLERANAQQVLTSVETAIIVAQATGQIDNEDAAMALSQLAELRKAVEQSASQPVLWSDILLRVANIAAQWAIGAPPQGGR